MLPIAKDISFAEVPLIDLASLASGGKEDRQSVATLIAKACKEVGFLYVKNHGVNVAMTSGMLELARTFFDLPMDQKMEVAITKNPNFRGYLPVFTKGTDPNIRENLQEAFQIYYDLPPDDPDVLARKPLHGPNYWPTALPELKPRMLAYMDEMIRLSNELLELFALGLALPENTFRRYFTKPLHWLRLLHYPPQSTVDASKHIGTRAHTDQSAFTILLQDKLGGLEVYNLNGDWIQVPPIDGTFIVNIGELMKVWTDGIYCSTLHRVINRRGEERYSVPFFATPSYDSIIEPLMHHPDPTFEPPVFGSSMEMHKKVVCGEFLVHQSRRIYPTQPESRA
jgi:isopenicillin N synthase-like dioxygenase